MKSKIIIFLVGIILLTGIQNSNAGILSSITKALGFKDDSIVGSLAKTADEIGNAVVAKNANDFMSKYGGEQINSYNEWANQYNDNQDRKVQQYMSEIDRFKMDYCKSHGFYDEWYSQYGDDWYERKGRNWFDSQDELTERRTGDRILPWHLRDDAGVIELANNSKTDNSLTNVVLSAFGLSDEDARRAEEWQNSDKYGKRDIMIDQAFSIIESTTDNKDMVNAFRRIAKANNHLLRDKANPNTADVATTNMILDFNDIIFDAYDKKAEKRKAYLEQKLQIRDKLESQGLDPSFANEVAGTILSIQNSKDLSEHEKYEWIRLLGFYDEEDSVLETAQSVSQMSERQAEDILDTISGRKEKEEKEKLEREEKVRKEKERNNAISTINAIVVDSYIIDKTDLDDSQKGVILNMIEILNNHDDLNIEIVGNTCDLGSEKINEKVGLMRAEKVKEYLIDSGIDEDRLTVSTAGENDPAFDNSNSQNRLKNRRVIFIAK